MRKIKLTTEDISRIANRIIEQQQLNETGWAMHQFYYPPSLGELMDTISGAIEKAYEDDPKLLYTPDELKAEIIRNLDMSFDDITDRMLKKMGPDKVRGAMRDAYGDEAMRDTYGDDY